MDQLEHRKLFAEFEMAAFDALPLELRNLCAEYGYVANYFRRALQRGESVQEILDKCNAFREAERAIDPITQL